ncbi:MAG: archaetidylserine decarboxylase [Puniceicoccales bacterium]|jgi:phosphatidylserine decarboxylase|nr:archaetidylserine decarboxylase [Puniceicoccales bacterium]
MGRGIQFYNRYTGKIETEPICGEWFIRLAYGTFLGRLLQRLIFGRPFFSRIAGWYANRPTSAKKIQPFVERYAISIDEILSDISHFESFNEFFCRQLKPGVRQIAPGRNKVVAPCDGRYFFIPNLDARRKISIKGRQICLKRLVGDEELAEKFYGGSALIGRLCPMDYHRFHFPCDGIPSKAKHDGDWLHSVHPLALQHISVFGKNKRMLTRVVTFAGEMLIFEVGAMFIGSIYQTYTPHRHVKKGAEKGFFSFGGSTVILIFAPNAFTPCGDIQQLSGRDLETYIRMGDHVGNFIPACRQREQSIS